MHGLTGRGANRRMAMLRCWLGCLAKLAGAVLRTRIGYFYNNIMPARAARHDNKTG